MKEEIKCFQEWQDTECLGLLDEYKLGYHSDWLRVNLFLSSQRLTPKWSAN